MQLGKNSISVMLGKAKTWIKTSSLFPILSAKKTFKKNKNVGLDCRLNDVKSILVGTHIYVCDQYNVLKVKERYVKATY